MKGLINASLNNPHAVIVMALAILVIGVGTTLNVPVDILPVFRSPAVQVLTFYGGMPAEGMEKDITNRMERWTGQGNGMKMQESRSIVGASIVRNYFFDDVDPNGTLTQVNSLALATLPNLPPGTLPPVVLPFDPTSTTPVCIVALNSASETESILYDVGRYEVRNYIMQVPGATAPVVIGGKLRAVMLYLDQTKMQSHAYSPADIMDSVMRFNLFFPSGDVKIGDKDYALSSNSMYQAVERMGDIPLKAEAGNDEYLRDVAIPKDSSFIQTNVVRVGNPHEPGGMRRQVYIPVYRQVGYSTLAVVSKLKKDLPGIQARLSHPDIKPVLVMDQSIFVWESIKALIWEASLGAVLCSLVILLFLGEWRMTLIAIMTLPLSVLTAIVCLHATGNTINVMTLAGLTLAIGPMIDSAIICLENTHRHLGMGADPRHAALEGASEVAMPELVSTICTFMVLIPLALVPGMGKFLFLPMTLGVMFAMTTAYLLSRTLVPSFSYLFLGSHGHGGHDGHNPPVQKGALASAFARWEHVIDLGIHLYTRSLNGILKHKVGTILFAYSLLAVTLAIFLPILRRDFFPEVDTGAFEIAVRGPAGTRIEKTEDPLITGVEDFIKKSIPHHDLELVISELGLTADWSAAYTPNSGPQDAILKVQLSEHHSKSAQEYASLLRKGFATEPRFANLEFAFDTGGMVRGALNEGKSTPINIQVKGKNQKVLNTIAEQIQAEVNQINGIVDARIIQKLDAPQLVVEVDRRKAAQLALTQDAVMKNVIAATNSSITFNKRNFWIDPITTNQYFVGVQYPETKIQTIDDLLNIPIRTPKQEQPIPLKEVATIRTDKVPTEIHHVNIQPAIDLTMGVEGRDLGHVCVDVQAILAKYGMAGGTGSWQPYDPRWQPLSEKGMWVQTPEGTWQPADLTLWEHGPNGTWHSSDQARKMKKDLKGNWAKTAEGAWHRLLGGSEIVLSGEYSRMQSTFYYLALYGTLAALMIYFLMVALDKSFIVPLTVMLVVPLCLCGVLPLLYFTGSAINVQSLLGIIFIVGIKVANTVLMTDYAQELRRHEGLSPSHAILKAASLRVRPVTMTALAALFAMIPTALEGGSANAPLARAIIGGLFAGEPATLFVLPALYALLIRDKKGAAAAGHHHAEDHGSLPDEVDVHVTSHDAPPAPGTPQTGPELGMA